MWEAELFFVFEGAAAALGADVSLGGEETLSPCTLELMTLPGYLRLLPSHRSRRLGQSGKGQRYVQGLTLCLHQGCNSLGPPLSLGSVGFFGC